MRTTDRGDFVIAWINLVPDSNLHSLALRAFDSWRRTFGEPVLVTENDPTVTGDYRFELNSSGQGVILWGDKVSLVTVQSDEPEGLQNEEEETRDHD